MMYDSVHLQSGLLDDPEYAFMLIYFRLFPGEMVRPVKARRLSFHRTS